jgi:hypothetical protein
MTHTRADSTTEACPVCHTTVMPGELFEWVPVCPLVYPQIQGLRCHETCLAEERERNRRLRPDDLRPALFSRRVADR